MKNPAGKREPAVSAAATSPDLASLVALRIRKVRVAFHLRLDVVDHRRERRVAELSNYGKFGGTVH